MKKTTHKKDKALTREYVDHLLSYRLGRLHSQIKKEIHGESHLLEFSLINRMDERFSKVDERFDRIEKGFDGIREEMKRQTDTFQKLADKVIGEHKKFEMESNSIHYNYNRLEERVKKVETVVFPVTD